MRAFHFFVASVAVLVVSLGAMDFLHGGWDAVAGGLMLMSSIAAPLSFAVVMARAERRT